MSEATLLGREGTRVTLKAAAVSLQSPWQKLFLKRWMLKYMNSSTNSCSNSIYSLQVGRHNYVDVSLAMAYLKIVTPMRESSHIGQSRCETHGFM